MNTGTTYTFESIERFLGHYVTVLITPAYGPSFQLQGLIYPNVQGVAISTERINIYSLNERIQSCWIKDVSKVEIESISSKTEATLSKLYQILLAENDALIKLEQERLKMEEKLRKLREKNESLKLRARKQASMVISTLGFVSQEKVKQELEEVLVLEGATPFVDSMDYLESTELLKFRHYKVSVREMNQRLVVDFYYEKEIEKWAQNAGYDFIFQEYDGQYYIGDTNSSDYQYLIKKHSRLLNSLTCSGLSSKEVKCSQSYSLELGDKYWLSLVDQVQLVIEADVYTKDLLRVAKQTLKNLIRN